MKRSKFSFVIVGALLASALTTFVGANSAIAGPAGPPPPPPPPIAISCGPNGESYTITVDGLVENGTSCVGELILVESATSVAPNAFYGSSIETLTLNAGLKSIGPSAFESLTITSLFIPESVETIGPRAFYNNYSLRTLIVGPNVHSIGPNAFGSDAPPAPVLTTCRNYSSANLIVSGLDPVICGHIPFVPPAPQSCSEYILGLSQTLETVTATWDANPISVSRTETLTVRITDTSTPAAPISGLDSCINLDSTLLGDSVTALSVSAFSEIESGTGVYAATVTFGAIAASTTAGYSITVNPMKVSITGAPSDFYVKTATLRINADALDIGSQNVTISGTKNTLKSKVITVVNRDPSDTVTISSDPTFTGSSQTANVLTAVGDGAYIIYTTSSAAPFTPGQLVTVSGFSNNGFNETTTQVIAVYNNTFTLAGTATGTETPITPGLATSAKAYIDSTVRGRCVAGLDLAKYGSAGDRCTVTIKWGISIDASTTATKIGTLTVASTTAQKFEIKGEAADASSVVTTLTGPSTISTIDPNTDWCLTTGGSKEGGSTTCTTGHWESATTTFSVDPAGRPNLARYYGNQNHPYGLIAGTDRWINCGIYLDSLCGNQQTLIFRIRFTLPTGWYQPAYTFTLQGDNFVEAWINPAMVDTVAVLTSSQPSYFTPGGSLSDSPAPQTTCSSTWQSYPNNGPLPLGDGSNTPVGNMYGVGGNCVTSNSHLNAGTNYIYVRVTDGGGLAGFNYRLDYAYHDPSNICLSNCGTGPGAGAPPKKDPLIPTFSASAWDNTYTGYTFQITDFDPTFTWAGTAAGGVVNIDSVTGVVTVSNNASAVITSINEAEEYPEGSATQLPPPTPPLKLVTITPSVNTPTSYYSKNLASAYTETVTISTTASETYLSGSYAYAIQSTKLSVVSANSSLDGLSVTYAASGVTTDNTKIGQFITTTGLIDKDDNSINLNVKNWQITAVDYSTGDITATVPTGPTAVALSASQFTASISSSKTVVVTRGGSALPANCALNTIAPSTVVITGVALPGNTTNTNLAAPKIGLPNLCTIVVSHPADGLNAGSTGTVGFTFVKEQPVAGYTGAPSTPANSRKTVLNSTWSVITGCTTPSKFTYNFQSLPSGVSALTTTESETPLQPVTLSLAAGSYLVTSRYLGDYNCESAGTTPLNVSSIRPAGALGLSPNGYSLFVVYAAGNKARGEGSYNAGGVANFEFETEKSKTGVLSGKFNWSWNNQWRFRGTITSYGKSTTGTLGDTGNTQPCSTTLPCGSISGAGDLSYYEGGRWISVGSAINFNASVVATTTNERTTGPGYFGIVFGYTPVSPRTSLPANVLTVLTKNREKKSGPISLN
jgi:BspA type Leucine rich repeat region (6 copies)